MRSTEHLGEFSSSHLLWTLAGPEENQHLDLIHRNCRYLGTSRRVIRLWAILAGRAIGCIGFMEFAETLRRSFL